MKNFVKEISNENPVNVYYEYCGQYAKQHIGYTSIKISPVDLPFYSHLQGLVSTCPCSKQSVTLQIHTEPVFVKGV